MDKKGLARKALYEITKPPLADNAIATYSDFLKIRDVLAYHQFNPKVQEALVGITCDLWFSHKRFSRKSLLSAINKYRPYKESNKTKQYEPLPPHLAIKVFGLLQSCIDNTGFIAPKHVLETTQQCNSLLIGASLNESAVNWLCINAENSSFILNRLLRYPQRSAIISKWARENYLNPRVRTRRAELTSWVLDEVPQFVVDKQTIADDLEQSITDDLNAIREFEEQIAVNSLLEEELADVLPKSSLPAITIDGITVAPETSDLSVPELVLHTRHYPVSYMEHPDHTRVPDFYQLRQQYLENISYHHQTTMLWAIAYSRLANTEKAVLLKPYVHTSTFKTFIKICKRYGLVEALEDI